MAEIIQEEKQEKGGKRKPKKHSTNIDMTPMVDLMCLLITFFMLTTAFSKPKVMEITMPEKDTKVDTKNQTKVQADRTINILLTGDSTLYYYDGLADPKKPPLPVLVKTDYKNGIRKYLLHRNKIIFKRVESMEEDYLKGTLVMTKDYLNDRIKDLKKMVEDKTETKDVVDKKIAELTKQFNNNDKDLKKEFFEWRKREIRKDKTVKSPIVLIKANEKAKYKNIVDIIDEMAICNISNYAIVDISDVELEMLKNAPK